MSAEDTGHYALERREGEIERLDIQGRAMAADTAVMLDRIGVSAGWRCLDLGCGPGGITHILSERVGESGQVVGLDSDPVFLDVAREHAPANVTFVLADAYRGDQRAGSFDLVHMRFVASTAGEPTALLREAIRLARPGGVVALQEPDMTTLSCMPTHPAWDLLRSAMVDAFATAGADINLARRLFSLVRGAGVLDVQYRPFLVGVRSGDEWIDYLPSTVESLRTTIVDQGLLTSADLDAALSECRTHLANPETVFTSYTVAQVWGRTPASRT
jgi:ubiquinone/menaquinone biosynthesis C-methylase UbiE